MMLNTMRNLTWSSGSTLVRVAWVVMPLVAGLLLVMGPHRALASMTYFFMVAGLVHRRERLAHVRLMSAAMMLDIFLVLLLELQRSAVETVVEANLNVWQFTHVGASVAAVLTYVPVAYFGWLRFTDQASMRQRTWHRQLGAMAFTFRTLGYVFMFAMNG